MARGRGGGRAAEVVRELSRWKIPFLSWTFSSFTFHLGRFSFTNFVSREHSLFVTFKFKCNFELGSFFNFKWIVKERLKPSSVHGTLQHDCTNADAGPASPRPQPRRAFVPAGVSQATWAPLICADS